MDIYADKTTVQYVKNWKDLNVQGMIIDPTGPAIRLEKAVKYPWILLSENANDQNADHPSSQIPCSHFDELPFEMIEHIVDFLDYDGILSLQRTSKFWRLQLNNQSFWQRVVERGNINSILTQRKPCTFPLVASSMPEAIAKISRCVKGLKETGEEQPLVFSSISIQELMALLQPDRPCYIVYRNKRICYFVLWCPDSVRVKQKMLAASFAPEVCRQLDCQVRLQMTDESEVAETLKIILSGFIP